MSYISPTNKISVGKEKIFYFQVLINLLQASTFLSYPMDMCGFYMNTPMNKYYLVYSFSP